MNLKLLLSILFFIYFKTVYSGELAFFDSTKISTSSKSTTSSNRYTIITPTETSYTNTPTLNLTTTFISASNMTTYTYKKEYLICDFNDPTSTQNICGGTFTNNANDNNVGIFQILKINTNEITDYSSIYQNTKNSLKCNIPFRYNDRDNYFCTKISDLYHCETSDGYSECNLGRFYGIQMQSNTVFDISWEIDSAFILPSSGNYTLKFYVIYICYPSFPISSNGCISIGDLLTVYTKSYSTESYSIVNTYKYSYSNSNDKWIENKIDLLLSTNSLYLKFTFERKREKYASEGGFGIDQITLINNNPEPSTTTSFFTTTLITSTTATTITTTSTTSTFTTTSFNNNSMTTSSSTKLFLTTSTPSKFISSSEIIQISTTQTSENLSNDILIFILVPSVSIIFISFIVILLIYHKRPRVVSPIKRDEKVI